MRIWYKHTYIWLNGGVFTMTSSAFRAGVLVKKAWKNSYISVRPFWIAQCSLSKMYYQNMKASINITLTVPTNKKKCRIELRSYIRKIFLNWSHEELKSLYPYKDLFSNIFSHKILVNYLVSWNVLILNLFACPIFVYVVLSIFTYFRIFVILIWFPNRSLIFLRNFWT